jgi:single-strand DNA-binding protein
MAAAQLAVTTSHAKNPDSTTWLSVLAFGRNAESLLACEQGDMVSATGRVQANSWVNTDGDTVEQLQLVADSLHSSRTVRPRRNATARNTARTGAARGAVCPSEYLNV